MPFFGLQTVKHQRRWTVQSFHGLLDLKQPKNKKKTHPGAPDTNMSPLKGSWQDDLSSTTVDMLIPRRIIPYI